MGIEVKLIERLLIDVPNYQIKLIHYNILNGMVNEDEVSSCN